MAKTALVQTIITNHLNEEPISRWIEAFLIDRRAKNLSPFTIKFYRVELNLFLKYCDNQVITTIVHLTPDVLRRYLLFLEENGRNAGGVNSGFRALRAFLFWYEEETEPDNWKNPIRKVKAPKVGLEPLNPVDLETVKVLVDVCPGDMFTGIRDRAIFLCLLDTGARAAELCAMNLADLDQVTGAILIRQGKGRKPRTVYLGKKSRKAIRAYLKHRQGFEQALWVTDDQEDRLTYWGLRGIVKRRAAKAGIQPPELHSFRRAFALAMLRAGVDVYSIQELMGHADLQILKRYLKQTDQDQRQAHERGGPVDNADF